MPSQTITTTAGNAQELATAVGWRLNLGRDATAAEIKTHTIDFLKTIVKDYRRCTAAAAADNADGFSPT